MSYRKYQEALIYLKKIGVVATGSGDNNVYDQAHILQELVDHVTPMAIKGEEWTSKTLLEANCPKCGKWVANIKDKIKTNPFSFCSHCGQALDWDKELPKKENLWVVGDKEKRNEN